MSSFFNALKQQFFFILFLSLSFPHLSLTLFLLLFYLKKIVSLFVFFLFSTRYLKGKNFFSCTMNYLLKRCKGKKDFCCELKLCADFNVKRPTAPDSKFALKTNVCFCVLFLVYIFLFFMFHIYFNHCTGKTFWGETERVHNFHTLTHTNVDDDDCL